MNASARDQRAAARDARRNFQPGSTPTRRGGIPPPRVCRNSGRNSGPPEINNSSPPPTIPPHILNNPSSNRSSCSSPLFWIFFIVALVFLFNYGTSFLMTLFTTKPNDKPPCNIVHPDIAKLEENFKREIQMLKVEKKINRALTKYDADKTGLPDLALESSGGEIVKCEKTKYDPKKASQLTFWGIPIYTKYNLPKIIIQPDVVPGKCWAFEGDKATVLIKLMSPGVLISFSIEHIPKAISPNGKIESAPKDFQVVGYTNKSLKTQVILGVYKYLDNNVPLQLFNIEKLTDTFYEYVELQILSNHGAEFTCIYRFRVHGSLQKLSEIPPNLLLNKFDRVCERGQCIFESKETKSETYLACTQDNYCSCSYDKQNNSNTSKDLEVLNRKCMSGVNGPCGEDDGLEIECRDEFECIKGRCGTLGCIDLRELNSPCLDDIDCEPGLICNKDEDEDGGSDNMNKCSIPKIKQSSGSTIVIPELCI